MTADFIKLLKVWLSVWLGLLTTGALVFAAVSLYDREEMSTHWSGNHLYIYAIPGQFFVTHLKDVSRHSFAELPKPLLVTSSGGVTIPHSDLTKLTWIVPPDAYDSAFPSTNEVVAAPTAGTPVEAIYQVPLNSKFRSK
jgi:hypothetical protein